LDPNESDKAAVPDAVAESARLEAAEKTAASASGRIDPIAVGGAVGGMTAGGSRRTRQSKQHERPVRFGYRLAWATSQWALMTWRAHSSSAGLRGGSGVSA